MMEGITLRYRYREIVADIGRNARLLLAEINNKGSMLLVFAPSYRGPCRMQHVSKGELIRQSEMAKRLGEEVPSVTVIRIF